MSARSEPKIVPYQKADFTKITFVPDLAKFGLEQLDDDLVALFQKRVYDLAGVLGEGVHVYFNGARIKIRSFRKYLDLYLKDTAASSASGVALPVVHEKASDRWEVAFTLSEGQFQQVRVIRHFMLYPVRLMRRDTATRSPLSIV